MLVLFQQHKTRPKAELHLEKKLGLIQDIIMSNSGPIERSFLTGLQTIFVNCETSFEVLKTILLSLERVSSEQTSSF